MLKIRLQRTGRINNPAYRLVVVEHTQSTKTGSIVEQVGSYNPKSKAKHLEADRIKYWISVGAQPSGTVHNMLVTANIVKGKKVNVLPQKSPPKKEGEGQTENSEQKASEPAAEAAPAEAAPAEPVAA